MKVALNCAPSPSLSRILMLSPSNAVAATSQINQTNCLAMDKKERRELGAWGEYMLFSAALANGKWGKL